MLKKEKEKSIDFFFFCADSTFCIQNEWRTSEKQCEWQASVI